MGWVRSAGTVAGFFLSFGHGGEGRRGEAPAVVPEFYGLGPLQEMHGCDLDTETTPTTLQAKNISKLQILLEELRGVGATETVREVLVLAEKMRQGGGGGCSDRRGILVAVCIAEQAATACARENKVGERVGRGEKEVEA